MNYLLVLMAPIAGLVIAGIVTLATRADNRRDRKPSA